MGMPDEPYYTIVVETFRKSGSGLHGDIHVRPIKGKKFPQTLHVRFPKKVRFAHPVGTRLRVQCEIERKEGSKHFLHTSHAWDYKIIKD